jgi:hypothetical protein
MLPVGQRRRSAADALASKKLVSEPRLRIGCVKRASSTEGQARNC